MFAKLSLGITGFIYLAMSYYYMFDMEGLFTAFGYTLPPMRGNVLEGVVIALSRYVAVSCFLIAFILLHMIPTKASAGLRTAVMTTALFGGVASYRAFFEEGLPAAAVEATKKNAYLQGVLLAMNFVALMSLPKEGKTKSS